jgi:hypothetical protein
MSDKKDLATSFLQKAKRPPAPVSRPPINSFDAMFSVQDLNEQEGKAIEKILLDGHEPGLLSEEIISTDIIELKKITKELKAINKQGLILIGERISKARDILKKYKEQSFREWLKLTYGSFKTGYNYISFFDLYTALPETLRWKLKEMPAKAAYILASKAAPIERKAKIVENYASESAQDLIILIQETLGSVLAKKFNRRSVIDRILDLLENETSRLMKRREFLNEGRILRVRYLVDQLEALLKHAPKTSKANSSKDSRLS